MQSDIVQEMIDFVENLHDNRRINKILRFIQTQQQPVSLSEVRDFTQHEFKMGKMATRKFVLLLEEKKCVKIKGRNSNGHAWQIESTKEPARYKFISKYMEERLLLVEKKVKRIESISKRNKFTFKDFYDLLDLQNEISQLPWRRYQSGMTLAEGIGMDLMRKTVKKCSGLNRELELIYEEQRKYQLQSEEILKILSDMDKLARYQTFPQVAPVTGRDRDYYVGSIRRGINRLRGFGISFD